MLFRLLTIFLFFSCLTANAQENQDIKYTISGHYDETTHILEASSEVSYINNTNQPLTKIYLNLWANAYNDKNSDYTRQSVRAGNVDFVYADNEAMGGYKDINAIINDVEVEINYDNPEIGYIILPEPLQYQEDLKITFEYKLQIPPKYDRFGHQGDDVVFAHFYPKVAVFEKGKWHKMPYLLYGEGYSEFADYKVNITFDDFESIASGLVDNKTRNSLDFNASDVVDAAFALSKTKKVQAFLINDTQVNVLTQDDIDQSIVQKSMDYLISRIGKFPYQTLGIYVDGKNGGMEYPGFINIPSKKEAQEYYLIHELAHEYFYGALHNNQRTEGWIDEGFATFYQKEYYKEFYGKDYYTSQLPKFIQSDRGLLHGFVEHQIARNFADRLKTRPIKSSPANYAMNHYEIPATYLTQLQEQIGKVEFDNSIKSLYNQKAHQHISGKDVIDAFPASAEWLSNAMTDMPNNDYAIKSLKNGVLITENKGNSTLPYPVVLGNNEKTIWIEGHTGQKETQIGDFTTAAIDPDYITIDKNRRNNYSKRGFKLSRPKLFTNPQKRTAFVSPYLGYNTSDNAMVGLGFSNGFLPYNPTKIFIAPSYSFGQKTVTGIVDLRQDINLHNNKSFRKIQLGLGGKRFSIREKQYNKVSPFISLHFNHGNTSQSFSKLTLKSNHIHYDYDFKSTTTDDNGVTTTTQTTFTNDWTHIQNLTYNFYNFFVLYPTEVTLDLEHQAYKSWTKENKRYVKLSAEWKQKFAYTKTRSVDFRLFGSYFIHNTERNSSSTNTPLLVRGSASLFGNISQDWAMNDYFFDRGRNNKGLISRQVSDYNSGGFKNSIARNIGNSNDYVISAGVKADLPIKLPLNLNLKGYFDYGIYNSKGTESANYVTKGLYSGGLMMEFADGLLAFHLPLINSKEISNIYKENGTSTFGKLTFKLDLKRFNLFDLADDFNP